MNKANQDINAPGALAGLTGKFGFSAVLLLMVYPLINAVATYPVPFTGALGGTVSIELLLSLVCLVIVFVEIGMGRISLDGPGKVFLLGVLLWFGTNLVSGFAHYMDATLAYYVFRMLMKATFGYMVFIVLKSSGRLKHLMLFYIIGAALTGLVTLAFWAHTGDLSALREAGFTERVSSDLEQEVDMFAGVARMGAGNILPVYFCIVLLFDERRALLRALWFGLLPYFALLVVLPLRREVFVEAAVAFALILPFVPRRYFVGLIAATAMIVASGMAMVIHSPEWQARLLETQDQFASGTDPRMILLKATPGEMLVEPVYGQGPAMYPIIMGRHFPAGDSILNAGGGMAAHNSYSRAAVESGILGLTGMVLFTGSLCWGVWRLRKQRTALGKRLHLIACLILLKIGIMLNFGDGISNNRAWFAIGVLLYVLSVLDGKGRGVRPDGAPVFQRGFQNGPQHRRMPRPIS